MPEMCRNAGGCPYLFYVLYVFVCDLYLIVVAYSVTTYPGQPRAFYPAALSFHFCNIRIVVELEVRCRGVHIRVVGAVQWDTRISSMGKDLQGFDLC